MNPWRKLTEEENHLVWDRIYKEFAFRPSVYSKDWPSIQSSLPQLKFDIMECFHEDYDRHCFERLDEVAQHIFREISNQDDHMLALNWQHAGYEFSPFKEYPIHPEYNEWPIPILPDGDYYIFLAKDFSNLWFAHPWEESITLIGADIVKAAQESIRDFEEMKLIIMESSQD